MLTETKSLDQSLPCAQSRFPLFRQQVSSQTRTSHVANVDANRSLAGWNRRSNGKNTCILRAYATNNHSLAPRELAQQTSVNTYVLKLIKIVVLKDDMLNIFRWVFITLIHSLVPFPSLPQLELHALAFNCSLPNTYCYFKACNAFPWHSAEIMCKILSAYRYRPFSCWNIRRSGDSG